MTFRSKKLWMFTKRTAIKEPLMETMNAGVFTEIGKIEFKQVEKPSVSSGEILVRVKASALCGTDIRILQGKKTKGIRLPSIIGHEFSGLIAETGAGVRGFVKGDRVCVDPVLPCGMCRYCQDGMENVCSSRTALGYEYDGCFAEYVLIPAAFVERGNVQKLPDSVSWIGGALAEPLGCVINGQKKLNVRPADTVVVIGAGPIGLMHCMLAKASGAGKVIVSEPSDSRRGAAEEFGADLVINPLSCSLPEIIASETGGLGADVVVLAIGNPGIVNDALLSARKGGRVSLFAGFSKDDRPEVDVNLIHYNELIVTGSSSLRRKDLQTALTLIGKGSINVEKLATARLHLEDIEEAFRIAAEGSALKVVMTE